MYFLTALLELGGDLTLVRPVSLILKSHQPTGGHVQISTARIVLASCCTLPRWRPSPSVWEFHANRWVVAMRVTPSLTLPLQCQLWQKGCVNIARRARSFIRAAAAGLWNRIPLFSAGATCPKIPQNVKATRFFVFQAGSFLAACQLQQSRVPWRCSYV